MQSGELTGISKTRNLPSYSTDGPKAAAHASVESQGISYLGLSFGVDDEHEFPSFKRILQMARDIITPCPCTA